MGWVLMTTRLTIFGSGGFVGGALCGALQAQGFSSKDADLADSAQVGALAGTVVPSSVWVVAAARSPDWAGTPIDGMRNNVAIAGNLAELIPLAAPRYVIYLSSIDVYGRENLALPLDESIPIRPNSYYAVSKYASEGILGLACKEAGVPFTVLRLPGVYGPGDTHWGPVHSFLDAAVRRAPITIYGDGEQLRDLLFVRDIPRLVQALCETPVPGTFNAVTGHSASLNEMLRIVERSVGETLSVVYKRDVAQIDLVFNAPLLLRRLPSLTLTPIADGIGETYAAMNDEG